MKKINDDLIRKLKEAGVEEGVIKEIIESGDEGKARLLLHLAENEKSPLLSLDEAAVRLGISLE